MATGSKTPHVPTLIRKPTLRERWRNWVAMRVYRLTGVRTGPYMFRTWADEWVLIDHWGGVWKVQYWPYDRDGAPLKISRAQ
jgi:hypothetical protein